MGNKGIGKQKCLYKTQLFSSWEESVFLHGATNLYNRFWLSDAFVELVLTLWWFCWIGSDFLMILLNRFWLFDAGIWRDLAQWITLELILIHCSIRLSLIESYFRAENTRRWFLSVRWRVLSSLWGAFARSNRMPRCAMSRQIRTNRICVLPATWHCATQTSLLV
jgi:hypothetical protein